LNFQVPAPTITQSIKFKHKDKIMLLGSCFTEHMSSRLQQFKFDVCANPHGILFNPLSIVKSLRQYLKNEDIPASGLFYLNEIWNHWDFHSRFSEINKEQALLEMNASIQKAATFLKDADWLVITLGSAFQYFLKPNCVFHNSKSLAVANCHRAPANSFEKRMLTIQEIINDFENVFQSIKSQNPKVKVLFTVSPVRHIRDGLIENNRSKARLLEVVHHFVHRENNYFYFPAYELVIDVLRDYRFYDLDMVHPNYQATQFVWEQFTENFMDSVTQKLLVELKDIDIAFHHKSRFPATEAHQKFKQSYLRKIELLKARFPYLNLEKERQYFQGSDDMRQIAETVNR